MAKENFKWTGETTWTRSFGTKAPAILEKGKTYDTEDFPADVLAEWVKTGHAKMTGAAKPDKEVSNG
jgi:hypothetical protein